MDCRARADGKGTEEDSPEAYLEAAEKWVDAMFSGPRAALRPVYDQLLNWRFRSAKT